MPRYSIILPVRNGGGYVKQCVTSILDQSLPDFNLQVLDNCSNDGTLEWLESLHDKRISIYQSEKPLTIEENWKRIIAVQKNEFITLIGHDDLLEKNYLAVMDKLIQKYPDASLYQAHFRYIDSNANSIRSCKPMDEIQTAAEFLAFLLAGNINIMGTGFMMRASDYDRIGGIPLYPNLLFADFELWVNLTRLGYKATAYEECFSFRLHKSMTATSADIKFQKAFGQFIVYLQDLKSKDSRFEYVINRYALDYIKVYCRSLAHRLLRTPKNKREDLTVGGFIDQCKEWADKLVPGNNFHPYDQFNIRIAKQIDSHFLSRWLFLMFKKMHSKPIYS